MPITTRQARRSASEPSPRTVRDGPSGGFPLGLSELAQEHQNRAEMLDKKETGR